MHNKPVHDRMITGDRPPNSVLEGELHRPGLSFKRLDSPLCQAVAGRFAWRRMLRRRERDITILELFWNGIVDNRGNAIRHPLS